MICRRCSHKINEIDAYCRTCGLKTYNNISEVTTELSTQMNKLNLNVEKEETNKSNILILSIGITVIVMLILILTILIYTILKNS